MPGLPHDATAMAGAVRDGTTTAEDAGRGRARADRRLGRRGQRVHRRPARGGARAGAGGRPRPRGVRAAGRGPGLGQGPHLDGRPAGDERLAGAARLRAGRRRRAGGPAARGGGCDRREDQQPGVLLPRLHRQPRVRTDPQPVVARPHAGGLERWRRRVGGVRRDAARTRDRRWRVDPHPVGVLRRTWAQAVVRSGPEAAGVPWLAEPLGRRTAGGVGPRPGPGRAGDGGRPSAPTRCSWPVPLGAEVGIDWSRLRVAVSRRSRLGAGRPRGAHAPSGRRSTG